MHNAPHRVSAVEPGSIADQCGIRPGDALLKINGEPVIDQIDYQFLTAQAALVLEILSEDGSISELHLEKDEAEPLGIVFASTLMSTPRLCANRCVFCFVDQMPQGLRDTLYVKDDDWRLSLMMGNYITLTNLSDQEFERIIARRASPLYVSVHAADGDVRASMMGQPRAARIMAQLERLRDAGIAFHCQVVLCPGLNDGQVLEDTIARLSGLAPAALSLALVPVGLTCHRDGLAAIAPFDRESACALIAQASAWQDRLLARIGTRFVFPADEFYCLAGLPIPPDEAYERYPQIENGVGQLRGFIGEFETAARYADPAETRPRRVLIATGTSIAPFFRTLLGENPLPGVEVEIVAVENTFFGPTITVAGLLTGQDLRAALKGRTADEILISEAMLRHEGGLFLDDDTFCGVQQALGIPIHAVGCDGADFFYAVQGELYDTEAE